MICRAKINIFYRYFFSSFRPSPLSITIPASATIGTNFIRIGTKFNTDPTSCASDWGEFEDYGLNVTAACTAPSTQVSSLVFSDQASTSQTLSWTRGN